MKTKRFLLSIITALMITPSVFASTGECQGRVVSWSSFNNLTFEITRISYISHWDDKPYGEVVSTSGFSKTVHLVDGMLSNWETAKHAISAGQDFYIYNNRGSNQMFSISTTPAEVNGEIINVDIDNSQVTIRYHLIKPKRAFLYEEPAYIDTVISFDPSMVFKHEGIEMDAVSAIREGSHARVYNERKQTVLAFTPDALEQDPWYPYIYSYGNYRKAFSQQGFFKAHYDKYTYFTEHRNGKWINSFKEGGTSPSEIIGCNSIYHDESIPMVRPGDRIVMVPYTSPGDGLKTKALFFRPEDDNSTEGHIVEIDGDNITLEVVTCPTGDKADIDTSYVEVTLESDAIYNLNGIKGQTKSSAIQTGNYVRILDAWSGAILVRDYDMGKVETNYQPPAKPYFITNQMLALEDELAEPLGYFFHPDTLTATENETVRISAFAMALDDATFQWYKDGEKIPGAQSLYYDRIASVDDNGSEFTCMATSPHGSDTAPAIVLVVNEDASPLLVDSASVADNQTIQLYYNKHVDETSAENITNYSINNGVTIDSITLIGDMRTVIIKTSELTDGTDYEITISNVIDLAKTPNQIASGTVVPVSFQDDGSTAKIIQTITFPQIPTQDFSETSITLNASTSSGLFPNYYVLAGPAVVSGDQLTFTDTGTVWIRAIQEGNESYYSAYAEQSFKVSIGEKIDQTISFDVIEDPTLVRTLPAKIGLLATSTSGLFISFELISGNASLSHDLLTIYDTGSVSVRATQSGNYIYNAAPEVIQTFMLDTFRGDGFVEINSISKEVSLRASETHTFSALVYDKYGDELETQPVITWDVEGDGTIDQNGFYTAPASTGTDYVIASVSVNGAMLKDTATVYIQTTQTITCHAFDSVYYLHDPFPLQCSASSGLPVEYERVSGPITLDGNIVTLLGVPGTAYVSAQQPGNELYEPAPGKLLSFIVSTTEPDDIIYSVDATSFSQKLSLYPNPSDGIVYISGDDDTGYIVRLMDTKGNVLMNTEVPVKNIDISKYSPGLYILEIDWQGDKIFKKIIKK